MTDTLCTIVKSAWIDDWYVLEREEHDGREWFEPTGENCESFRRSARLSHADIEGTREEWLAISDAIESGGCASFKRCHAETKMEGVILYSPRNSQDAPLISHAAAMHLARNIRRVLKESP